jgi:hypothetical protein
MIHEADDQIPVIAVHRGVGVHAGQDEDRVTLVRREIDFVLDQIGNDFAALIEWATSARHCPESRLLAGARATAIFENAVAARRDAGVSAEFLRAVTAGAALHARSWRCRFRFTSILDADWRHAVERPEPLSEEDVE